MQVEQLRQEAADFQRTVEDELRTVRARIEELQILQAKFVHRSMPEDRGRRPIVSAVESVVLLHLRDNLRIGELVRGFDSDNTLGERLGAAKTLLELQLGFPRPED